jgi:hypothetical protein
MNEWRNSVRLDLENKSVTVLLTKSPIQFGHGHLLQDPVFGQSYALEYFFDKFKFARTVAELNDDWKDAKKPYFGIRKKSIEHTYPNRLAEETSMTKIAKILAGTSENPIETVKQSLQPAHLTPAETPKPSLVSQPLTQVVKDTEQDTHKSPTPSSIKPTPPGFNKQ